MQVIKWFHHLNFYRPKLFPTINVWRIAFVKYLHKTKSIYYIAMIKAKLRAMIKKTIEKRVKLSPWTTFRIIFYLYWFVVLNFNNIFWKFHWCPMYDIDLPIRWTYLKIFANSWYSWGLNFVKENWLRLWGKKKILVNVNQ